jgi:hypothetical protein
MSNSPHASSPSQDGAAFSWIVDHVMSHPESYEIPLRTMYTLNSSPRAQPFPKEASLPSTPSQHRSDENMRAAISPQHLSASHFTSHLVSHLSQLSKAPTSLPPSFLNGFIRKTFKQDLTLVDFPQSLTALDYLRDLDSRRRREIVSAVERLGIRRDAHGQPEIDDESGAVSKWLIALQAKEKKSEEIYSFCYIGLRRWVCMHVRL